MKYLFDTDHISIMQRQSGSEFLALAARIARESPADLAFGMISFHEQMLGCHTFLSRARDSADLVRGYAILNQVLRTFSVAPVLPFDASAAAVFDGLLSQKVRVGTMDLRIAAIALSRGLILLTRNVSDFSKVPGLQTENWTV